MRPLPVQVVQPLLFEGLFQCYEALEKALKQERLDRQRAHQQLQAKAAQAEAGAKKAVRVLIKGVCRYQEH